MYYTRDNLPGLTTVYSDEELANTPWYYSIELEPGRFTNGQGFWNVALTRELLSRASLEGARCIDIGTMEGLIPTVMCQQGAKEVVAYDRVAALTGRINQVKAAYKVDFDFVSGFAIPELRDRLADRVPFDVVVMSGVLYHMFSPLTGIAVARGLVRNGGIVILETAAVVSNAAVMYFNERDRFTGNSYFLPSLSCLDYMVRFLHMSIIDCVFVPTHQVDGLLACRVAIACRAETKPVGLETDEFLQGTLHTETDVREHVDWKALESDALAIPYATP